MSYFKNNLKVKITVFLLITSLIFWLIPSNLIFGEGEDQGGDGGTVIEPTGGTEGEVIPPEDTIPPVITISGDNPVTVEVGAEYVDAGATASDDVDGDITGSITVNNAVDTSAVGTYSVTYNISDNAGNAAVEITRTVNVVEPTEEEAVEEEVVEEVVVEEPLIEELVTNPVLFTDKADYSPEETVIITGTGFLPNVVYTIVVTRPDGSVVIGDGSFVPGSDSILTDASGAFTYNYILDGILGVYTVNAVDESGAVVATTTFTDCTAWIKVYKFWDKDGDGVQDGNEPLLSGAVFKLYKKDQWGNWDYKAQVTTGSDGLASFNITSYGKYKVVETTPPPGYTGSYNTGELNIQSDQTITRYAPNTARTGSITVCKSGLEGSDTAVFSLIGPAGTGPFADIILDNKSGGYPSSGGWSNLPFGSYTITETWGVGNVYIYTTDLSSNPKTINVDGDETLNVTNRKCTYSVTVNKCGLEWGFWWADKATFTLTGPAGPNSQVRTATLNNFPIIGNPSVTWSGLPAGQYSLNESYPGDNNYTYTSNIVFPQIFNLGPSQTFNVVNTKTTCTGTIVVTKSGLEPGDLVSISLYKGAALIETKPNGGNGIYTFSNLAVGNDYSITETYASGNTFTYAAATQTPGNPINVPNATPVNVSLVNCPIKGSIVVTKSGLEPGDLVSISLYKGATLIETKPNDGNVVYTFSNLAVGSDYSITETYAGGNTFTYAAATQTPGNPISVLNATPVNVSLVNNPERGSIEIFKTDATNGQALGGSTFQLFKWGSWTQVGLDIVLGPDGHYKWDPLPLGLYKVVETIAPPGYLLAPPVEVTLDGETPNVILTQEIADPRIPGRVTVIKRDEAGANLDGVGFTIYYKDSGNAVMPEKFTAGGVVTFDGLGWNTYIVVETTQPAGFDKSGPVEVTIDASNAEAGVIITLTDKKTPPPPPRRTTGGGEITVLGIQELPFTGMNPAIPISGISSMFAGGLMVMLSSIKRRLRRK